MAFFQEEPAFDTVVFCKNDGIKAHGFHPLRGIFSDEKRTSQKKPPLAAPHDQDTSYTLTPFGRF